MKIRNVTFILIASTIFAAINANQIVLDKNSQFVHIANDYRSKIVLNINGQDAAVMAAYDGKERLYELPDAIKIRTEKGMYHSSINKELDKVKDAAKKYPAFEATITIRNTSNPITFDYSTIIKTPLAQKIYDTRNITPIIDYVFANQQLFPRRELQLKIILHSIYKGSSNSKDAVPTTMLASEIYKEASAAVQKKASDNDFIKSTLEAINRTYHRMMAQWQQGSVQFNPIKGIMITPELLNSLLDINR